ncbi:MAG: Gfo/Idh/MocA family oxidoreductase [Kiritimatiellae bacterium]|nr:Gfo/Idh/MocA family oxidoreductase [Kiritimatiellia bacterium]
MSHPATSFNRRAFLRCGAAAGVVAGFPTILPSRVLGAQAPSKKLALGVIGCGRIAHTFNVPSCLANGGKNHCEFIALSDVDLVRLRSLRGRLAGKKMQGRDLVADARCYQDYRKLLADPAIDGVLIATPDFWHAQMAVEACLAGKDVFLQKPMALTVGEGRAILNAAKKCGRILRTGTQQRTEENFIHAVECVREGRIGKVVCVEVGVPDDPKEYNLPLEEPVPADFDWNLWQGPAPEAPYAQIRSHQRGAAGKVNFARPGWMTIQSYTMGMVANWGAHHMDTAIRGLGEELGGPATVEGTCEYPKRRLWDVHGECDITWTYPSGATIKMGSTRKYPCGVRFIGEKGDWVFCGFAGKQTKSDPVGVSTSRLTGMPIAANRKGIIEDPVAKPLLRPMEHNREWVEEMRTRGPLAMPLEEAQRTSVACVLGYTALKLGRKLKWDAKAERFLDDAEANKTLFREERAGFGVKQYLKDLA